MIPPQTTPLLGVFEPGPFAALPAWVRFTWVLDSQSDDTWAEAAADARATGRVYVLYLHTAPLDRPIEGHAAAMVDKAKRTGLWRHLVAVCLAEEWYEQAKAGTLTTQAFSLTPPTRQTVALIHAWAGQQYEALKRAFPDCRTVWLTTFVNADPQWGPWWLQPVPDSVDLVAIEAYTPAGMTWASTPEVVLTHALTQTSLPLVIVAQWFREPAGWSDGPPPEAHTALARWAQHPRVVAIWGFLWQSRPTIVGIADPRMADTRRAALAALGIRETLG